ncbi:MAG: carbamoyltransferase HypF [Candidatus Aegiribacteria sp.]|nr:carbamoyltransferase HypF [Candidatus Aegiribacteria sp.]
MQRLRLEISGAVQGVGFRPFVYRLAHRYNLAGWVSNTSKGVVVEVDGDTEILARFAEALLKEKPPVSIVQDIRSEYLDAAGFATFEIRASTEGKKEAFVLPDLATCGECSLEILDPDNRRYRYPFTNCTNCGPRYSIINAIPYDRPSTTMSGFRMCGSCLREYEDPFDRRFHAQPNACPECGPHLELWDPAGVTLAERDNALRKASAEILDGKILAIKGLGGFHLITLASSDEAVRTLRYRKGREMKPFALMFPSIFQVSEFCVVSSEEKEVLQSPRSPIVLLKKRDEHNPPISISELVSPSNHEFGVMLPYTPLHILLMMEIGEPVIATSGNLSDEPICIDEIEALERLKGIADYLLVHNRPIARHLDDSIVRIFKEREMVLRRARGYAPLPLSMDEEAASVLATGGHLKNTLALSIGRNVFTSQHIGDLETVQALRAFDEVWNSIEVLYDAHPDIIAYDMHPDYISSARARESQIRGIPVQHHIAHVYSCMLDSAVRPPLLGVAWDGTGYGTDGTVWGGEFFHITGGTVRRIAHLRHFPLPGGERAAAEPRRSALGLLSELFDDPARHLPLGTFSGEELDVMKKMISSNLNSPLTSSAGRLFDAVASILDLHQTIEFEGQAAMSLEHAIGDNKTEKSYPVHILEPPGEPIIIDWAPLIEGIIIDASEGMDTGIISAKFHNTLAEAIAAVAEATGEKKVVLSGGCFQNVYLLQRVLDVLENIGYEPFIHRSLPPNDGGIAPGQVMAALMMDSEK